MRQPRTASATGTSTTDAALMPSESSGRSLPVGSGARSVTSLPKPRSPGCVRHAGQRLSTGVTLHAAAALRRSAGKCLQAPAAGYVRWEQLERPPVLRDCKISFAERFEDLREREHGRPRLREQANVELEGPARVDELALLDQPLGERVE